MAAVAVVVAVEALLLLRNGKKGECSMKRKVEIRVVGVASVRRKKN